MIVPLGAAEHGDGADEARAIARRRGRGPRRRSRSRPRRRPSKSSRSTPAGIATTRAGGTPAAITMRADGLPAGDDAVRQPAVHRVEAAADGNRDVPGADHGHAGQPRRHARRASRRSSCACGRRSTRSRRISRTRREERRRDPRRRASACATAGEPRSRARGSSRPSGWAAMSTRQPRSAIQPASVERPDLLPAESGRGLGVEDRLHATAASHRGRRPSSAVIARMHGCSMGHSARKQGAHGAARRDAPRDRTTRGALSRGSVGPKSVTVGMPSAAARCATPVSALTRHAKPCQEMPGRSAGRSRPTRDGAALRRRPADGLGGARGRPGPPRSTGASAARG